MAISENSIIPKLQFIDKINGNLGEFAIDSNRTKEQKAVVRVDMYDEDSFNDSESL